jgi:cobalt-zinc-cadmium efflux system protein
MAHDHPHHHDHPHPQSYNRAFAVGIVLNLGFVVVEAVYGVLAHSLALLADAGHNLSDVLALALAWGASSLARRGPTQRFTYGFRSSSILAALLNAALLLVVTGGLAWEAIQRLAAPGAVAGQTLIWVALAGIAVNAASAMLFARDRRRDINMRGAFLHMAGDAAVSLGVVVAALLIGWTGRLWLDPAVSLMVAAVILATTWGLTRDAVNLAVDAVPAGIDRHAVETYLAGLPGVTEVHDLHIWAMSTTETALTVHLVRPNAGLDDHFLTDACHTLEHRFGIHHATIQIEAGVHACRLAPDHVV